MKRAIQITNDGSTTIALPEKNITYHSTSGAIGESLHVFIEAGLRYVHETQNLTPIYIFEMGFGTGLNALLSWQFAQQQQVAINYTSIERYPILPQEAQQLNFDEQLQMITEWKQLHSCEWQKSIVLDKHFTLTKWQQSLLELTTNQQFHLMYFDAFAPNDQPELWTKAVFEKLYNMLLPNGILVTYCSKGEVKRTLKSVGFTVERLLGFANKWHMLRASK
ncbi:MAG: tRNA (5-methylaminomethyl-2-thiouridine)(34)-methyltransferase MnmD [Flavobacterium sp.]|nr:tRNA (5-methylaminomethyl-2-thiouridine)(34)-methyltransferase MnmD [Flavobacterium sp.]